MTGEKQLEYDCGRMKSKYVQWIYSLFLRRTTVRLHRPAKTNKVIGATSQLYHINIKPRQPLSEGTMSKNVAAASFPL